MPKTPLTEELYQYCLDYGVREHPLLQQLRQHSAALNQGHMLVSPDQGALLAMLAKLINARHYLEIGMFTGYSALWVALAIAPHGKVTTLDLSAEHLELANSHWRAAGVNEQIEALIAPASDSLNQLVTRGTSFDLALIDANKAQYLEYYELALKLVRPGGLIVIDNVLMYGQVLEAQPAKKYVQVLKQLNQLLATDPRVDVCMLPIGDGLTLARKKEVYEASHS
jgi:predicted O-methyltransferase YrrM